MVLTKKILILEDDLQTLSKILHYLTPIEQDQPYSFSLVVLTDYKQVEKYINSDKDVSFDIILLDRDCQLGGSFHTLDLERFGADKVIAISTVPEYNLQVKERGVNKIVEKDYRDLDVFAIKVAEIVSQMLIPQHLQKFVKNKT